jgi:NADPH2:quinone reductase
MNTIPETFTALRIHSQDGAVSARYEKLRLSDLSDGDVVVKVSHSSINYKDALAATGAGKILRRYPLVGGVDVAGTVIQSTATQFKPGDAVLCTGCSLSETIDGGYSEVARLPAEFVIPMPVGLDAQGAMAIGTAGFSAALAIERMEHNGLTPERGAVAVTGAAGGVGSVAIDMLAARGYQVIAISGRPELTPYLQSIGATSVLPRAELAASIQPLGSARWAGAIDNAGGPLLHALLAGTRNNGCVASVGLAATAELNTTVMPFILRGVNLLGVNSSATPTPLRHRIWARIATDLRPRHLDRIVSAVIPFSELLAAFPAYLKGAVRGRQVVRIA